MIGIYEPLYRAGQTLEEPEFIPLPIENSRPTWREFGLMVDMYRKGLHRRHTLTGLFSPKFRAKAKITGADFIRHVENSQRADLYIFNAPAQVPYFSYNMWMEGECHHAGLVMRAQALLHASGIPWRLDETPRQPPGRVCYNNFWVGTAGFWEEYVGGVLVPIAEFLERQPDSEVARNVLAPTFHREPTPFLPFIGERLLSTYLSHNTRTVVPYTLDPMQTCIMDFERDMVAFMRARVDRADREGFFPPDLIAWMGLLCRLRVRYWLAYFATHPDPYLGSPVDPALIAIGLRGLAESALSPLPPLPD